MTLPPLLQGPQRGHIDGDRLEINMRQTLLSFWALARVVTITSCSSQPSMVHWLISPIFPRRRRRRRPAMVTSVQISLLVAPHPKTHTFSESL